MTIDLTALHWIYLVFIGLIILFMVLRKDTTIICILGIFSIALAATGSFSDSVISIFDSFVYAITQLLSTILVISIIVAMSKSLTTTGINDVMIAPFTKLIKTPALAFWTIGVVMMVISWFFWPSPAVALLGAVLVPVALKVGLPSLGAAMAMNLFGHGIALSGDFVIQAAPKLTADAAGLPVAEVMEASIPLIVTMGVVTTVTAFIFLKRDMNKGLLKVDSASVEAVPSTRSTEGKLNSAWKKAFAILIPILFLLDVLAMVLFNLQGGEATALIGGTSIIILLIISLASFNGKGLERTTNFLVEGFQFGFKVFGPVIPIAAFFYLGDAGFSMIIGDFLPSTSQGIVNDLGASFAAVVPLSNAIGAGTLTIVGAITGLDGSGFSGISLAGSVANLVSESIGSGAATLTALGQVAGIWVGGGTLVPWALIPAAAICNVDPFELARRNLAPVTIGLVITTIVAIFLI